MINQVCNVVADVLDKVQTPTTRAGITVSRVAALVHRGVDKEVIALQLSKNSVNGHLYSSIHIDAFEMLMEDAYTKVGITKAQTQGLYQDQVSITDLEKSEGAV